MISKPNPSGHKVLAELEKMGKVKAVIRLKISDNLHQEGGSKKVLELHRF